MEIKEEGTKHMLVLFNVRMDMAGGVDFSAANAKSTAMLRVKGVHNDNTNIVFRMRRINCIYIALSKAFYILCVCVCVLIQS